MRRVVTVLLLLALANLFAFSQTNARYSLHRPLVVGWHDEMNDLTLWKPLALENTPDIYASRPGLLTLRLPHVLDGFPYAYQWSGVTRSISADLGHYPILIAHVSSLDEGSYAHLDIEERDFWEHAAHVWRSPTLTHPGLSIIDLEKELGPSVRRLTLRLIVGGKLAGAKCEYNWVRFVRRKDVASLQGDPDLQTITSTEPTGSTPVLTATKN